MVGDEESKITPQSDDNRNFIEIIAIVIMLFGVCAGLAAWLWGQSLWDSGIVVFLFLLVGGLIALVGEGLRTGKLGAKGGDIHRERNPFAFWGCAIFYVIVAIFLFMAGVASVFLEG